MIKLPIPPMLATAAAPFDDFEYTFEIKWDGVRALAGVTQDDWRLWGRDLADYRDRYPELDCLRRLPAGSVVDGEIVVLRDDVADLNALLGRHQLTNPLKIRYASRQTPVHYILFDALCHDGKTLFDQPFYRRRGILLDLYEKLDDPRVRFSEPVVGLGKDFFERAVARGHEGIVAKHHASRYLPGRRSAAWRKIKPRHVIPCAIVGYRPSRSGLHSVLVAAEREGRLCYIGELTCGFTMDIETKLAEQLARRVRRQPVVVCPHHAIWVEPEIFCRVHFQHWTPAGRLRGAAFAGLIEASTFAAHPERN